VDLPTCVLCDIFNLKGALDLFSLAFAVWRWPALPLLPPGAALPPPPRSPEDRAGLGQVSPGQPGLPFPAEVMRMKSGLSEMAFWQSEQPIERAVLRLCALKTP
jgi:hypothetical protein